MEVRLLVIDVIQEGKCLPTLPLVTVAEPGEIPGPPGGCGTVLIPIMGLSSCWTPGEASGAAGSLEDAKPAGATEAEVADFCHAGFSASVADPSFWRRVLDVL